IPRRPLDNADVD
nr:hypothetical protein [Tanacetum cinerariifolium]